MRMFTFTKEILTLKLHFLCSVIFFAVIFWLLIYLSLTHFWQILFLKTPENPWFCGVFKGVWNENISDRWVDAVWKLLWKNKLCSHGHSSVKHFHFLLMRNLSKFIDRLINIKKFVDKEMALFRTCSSDISLSM